MDVGSREVDAAVWADPGVDETGRGKRRFNPVEFGVGGGGIDVHSAPERRTRSLTAIGAPGWWHRFHHRAGGEVITFRGEVGEHGVELLLLVAQPGDVPLVLAAEVVAER